MPGSENGTDVLAEQPTLRDSPLGPSVASQYDATHPAPDAGEHREMASAAQGVQVPADEPMRDGPLHPGQAFEVWLTAARHLIAVQPEHCKPSDQQLVAVALEGDDSPVACMYTAFVRNCNAAQPDLHMLFGLAFAGNALALEVVSKRLARKRKH